MGWFSKTEKKRPQESPRLPELPRLPDFPNFPELEEENSELQIHQLPSFPANSIGEKFSQNTIKDAVTGRKEDDKGVLETDDFADIDNNMRMMEEPQEIGHSKEIKTSKELPFIRKESKQLNSKGISEEFRDAVQRIKKIQPVFIRIDKFEESLNNLEKAKMQVFEIEKMLKDIQKIKEEEDSELILWENEIQSVKEKIEKVERDIFSKIE